jgi:hypothetical protein
MAMLKILSLTTTGLMGLALTALLPPPPDDGPAPPPKKAKKKEDRGPGGDLKKAYNLLRRIKADGRSSGRPEERLRDWTDRATRLYRDGVKAAREGNERLAHEYGASAHDLARAIDHARNAALFDARDDDLPPPPDADGTEGDDGRARHDLRIAYDRITDLRDDGQGADARFYIDAARDLYNAARRDAQAGRSERAGELAKSAEALTHVIDHLAHAANGGPEPPDRDGYGPEAKPKRKGERPDPKPKKGEKGERPDPKGGRDRDELPPPL